MSGLQGLPQPVAVHDLFAPLPGLVRRPREEAPGGLRPHRRGVDLEELETWAIRQALQRTGGNITQAAKLLGCVRDTLASKIKKKGIDPKLVEAG